MDELDLLKELYGEPEEPELPDEDDEIQLNIRNYRSDDAFERMLAELNGKYASKQAGAARDQSVLSLRSKPSDAVQPQTAENAPSAQPAAPDVETQPAPEAAEFAEAAPPPPPPPKPVVKRKKPPEKKSPEQLEKERREREKKAEQELFERREREAREREQQFIEKISNIWNTPEFAEGGRVEMNIRTNERKEIRITLPAAVSVSKEPDEQLNYTPLIPSSKQSGETPQNEELPRPEKRSPEEEKRLLEEAARRDAQNRTEKAASRKISIRKKR